MKSYEEVINGMKSYEEVINEFEEMTRNAGAVQETVLRQILEKNARTEYLRKWNLNGRTDAQSFRSCVPLVTHADLEPYIKRISDGDTSPVLTADPIRFISLSSGTTNGKQKSIPFTDDLLSQSLQVFRISGAYRSRLYPLKAGGRVLEFVYSSRESMTKGRLVTCTATTNLFRHGIYRKSTNLGGCSPQEVIFGNNARQSLYCHLLCGLLYATDVQVVQATFAYSIVDAFRYFEQVWEDLCSVIREGNLGNRITVPSMREAVSVRLHPNPALADSIYEKCKNAGNWYGIIPCLWPNAKFIKSIMTGSMEPYLKKLRHYAGSLPLMSADYGSTEGWIAANIDPTSHPENAKFTIIPNLGYFEFIPVNPRMEEVKLDNIVANASCIEGTPVTLTEVKVGQEYEVVMTTVGGLYRYRLGDIVKVMGFYNSSPQLAYVCRKQLILTVNIDKTTEKDLQMAVDKAMELLKDENVELVDFTSYANLSKEPGNYVIFWELSSSANDQTLRKCCSILDGSFVDPGYTGSRKASTIGPLELCIVQKGTFKKILDHYVSLGGAVSQYKTPRCITFNQALLEVLQQNVIQTYVSTYYS